MAQWVRRSFDAVGVTQYPPGPHLAVWQSQFGGGYVILCVDASGSMSAAVPGHGNRLRAAAAGARVFLDEARAAGYQVGLILWDTAVVASVPLSTDPARVLAALGSAHPGGGTEVAPALWHGIRALEELRGDRVLAVFGDGDVGSVSAALAAAQAAREREIRIIVRGLGAGAARSLLQIATEDDGESLIPDGTAITQGIGSMIKTVTRGRLGGARRL